MRAALVFTMVFAAGLAVGSQTPESPEGLLQKSAVFLWEATPPRATDKGAVRSIFRAPSITLDELEYHITTLNPNQSPHAPHQHVNEEVIIVKEGAVEAFVNGAWTPVTTGSLIFFASNVPHTVRNVRLGGRHLSRRELEDPGGRAESDGRSVMRSALAACAVVGTGGRARRNAGSRRRAPSATSKAAVTSAAPRWRARPRTTRERRPTRSSAPEPTCGRPVTSSSSCGGR